MTGPTPSQKRRIEELVHRFEKDWYIDRSTKEIRHKPFRWHEKVIQFFVPRRHKVFALYWFAKYKWSELDLMSFSFPIRADQMPVPGLPIKYELQGGWTIPDEHLRYLSQGPLMSEGLVKVLVPHELASKRLIRWLTVIGKVLSVLISLISLSVLLWRYWDELTKILQSFWPS